MFLAQDPDFLLLTVPIIHAARFHCWLTLLTHSAQHSRLTLITLQVHLGAQGAPLCGVLPGAGVGSQGWTGGGDGGSTSRGLVPTREA